MRRAAASGALAVILASLLPATAGAVAYITIPELEIRLTLFGVDGPSTLPVRSQRDTFQASILVRDTLLTIERSKARVTGTIDELWPALGKRLADGVAPGDFAVNADTPGLIGGQPARFLQTTRERKGDRPTHWLLMAAVVVDKHLYVFHLYSTERAPWKNKAVMKILERVKFAGAEPQSGAAEDPG